MPFEFSHHALEEMQRRGIPRDLVEQVLEAPQQIVPGHGQKQVYQSQIDLGDRTFLVRVVVAEDVEPPLVVTVYRTSQISKYWRAGP